MRRRKMKKYVATIRLQRFADHQTLNIKAENIREAAEIVREKHGVWSDDPHNGFTIQERTAYRGR